jgi:hypothetical protein
VKLFECQNCGGPLYFENNRCESCGLKVGYAPRWSSMLTLRESADSRFTAIGDGRAYKACLNEQYGVCNWLIEGNKPEAFCSACRHNRIVPDVAIQRNLVAWRKIESAKHQLFYSLTRLNLPLALRGSDPKGFAFDFLADVPNQMSTSPIKTGHADGVITININEADDAERERQRQLLGEPYRTLLGHFRHEIGHYYWDRLVHETPLRDEYRALFGDESEPYAEALARHYSKAPSWEWQSNFVSNYASSHPWEDFAETWAHYFHMIDTLETACSFGIQVQPRVLKANELFIPLWFDPYSADIDTLLECWLPLTYAMNSINRSMGLPDLYPFLLTPPVISKLKFVHKCIHGV